METRAFKSHSYERDRRLPVTPEKWELPSGALLKRPRHLAELTLPKLPWQGKARKDGRL
jgi:hypothetical protein